ncbi:hypothetical protein A3K34_00975 [candidate division WWE3 bacterium RIFOXYC1_FULL_40_10]|uniref:Uncharacterized protein n=1 Tax=candidate division WWE3 bacterium RIFOXYA2_FULL_46_9 TaxID=1802636 RepID=A0A1F4W267_UNCKA|nr:MAG: hypothetical protein A3K58_00975 [candidate division WWE3 bacterium RIFOXYB1_FULL_40_22]OGC61445.1 MAG: hypothetical protein A3K37_00975 [candidate division WWE3 bacterium RIFOXYA1_FULL_40_11]OGC63378.1 MAG: hypothetical protein A2264_01450 [candidate division WWE3 bacterium RIFOXYA2_FULL_46_9]OGC64446.1 MAG: hypothetical protein A2326_00250 [candidate division WWE3 bacterium RIFOXYB2_FULL_41_6]OGC65828.1 MAG: hypothetical protein A3K34_00975 [candidate division WWE3 bacterium RIFOXYC1_
MFNLPTRNLAAETKFQQLLSLGMPSGDYAIFGSAPLWVYNITQELHDLDVIARGAAWEIAKTKGVLQPTKSNHGRELILFEGNIEISNKWITGEWNINELIDTSEIVQGVRLVNLEYIIREKLINHRERDKEDLKKIEEFISLNRLPIPLPSTVRPLWEEKI